jgi:hypothetical protein
MFHRKGTAALAACTLLVGGSLVKAAQPATSSLPAADLSLSQPVYADDNGPPAAESLLADGLGKAGMKGMIDNYGLKFSGFAEVGYTYSLNHPGEHFIPGRVFDYRNKSGIVDQLDLAVEKDVDITKPKFDIGGKIEFTYGADAGIYHAHGIFSYFHNPTSPQNQPDLTQAYVDVAVPVGDRAVDFRIGKFVTPLGYETINPVPNPLYSHSYSFGFAIPFTQTGITASYNVTDKLNILVGGTESWDSDTINRNSAITFLGEATYTISPTWKVIVNSTIGPELTHNDRDFRYVIEPIVQYTPANSPITAGIDPVFAFEDNSVVGRFHNSTAYWYGAAVYGGYKINDFFTANIRGEWFRDQGGTRLGIDDTVYEVTAGLTVHPFPRSALGQNFIVRPELRYDYSDKLLYDGGREHNEFTFGVDAIFSL